MGEATLWTAVLVQAVIDLRFIDHPQFSDRGARARAWLFEPANEPHLREVCAAAELDVARVRAAARKAMANPKRLSLHFMDTRKHATPRVASTPVVRAGAETRIPPPWLPQGT